MNIQLKMSSEKLYKGYDRKFIEGVDLPTLHCELDTDILKTTEFPDGIIPYINYSVMMSTNRLFAYYSAANIDGRSYQKIPRKDYWRKDNRVKNAQLGQELYKAADADFDRGHLTKREDVQWGSTLALALKAADSTFYFTNAVPQHKDLNRDVWRSLEDYILHTETRKKQLRICVMTGPVLKDSDPEFKTSVNDKNIQIPLHFWKIVYFQKEDNQLYRVGFLMSHSSLLKSTGIIYDLEMGSTAEDLFLNFKKAGTYQVNIDLIEQVTNLRFAPAIDSYQDNRPLELIFEEIDIDPELESDSIEQKMGFSIANLLL
jgi:endonuclease G